MAKKVCSWQVCFRHQIILKEVWRGPSRPGSASQVLSTRGPEMTSPAIAAVIPVYNDRKSLERAIPVSLKYLAEITPDFELIIAEDGSTDGSADLVRDTSRTDPRVRLLHSDERLGRGMALNRAFRGDI